MFAESPTFRPLRSRNFRLIWTGALVSNIGTWMETVALASLVATRTRSATQVAIASIAGFLPSAFAAPIGSALADRFDRRRFLITTLAMETSFAALLTILVALGERRTLVLSGVVFAASIVNSAALPNRQSLLPSLVDREDVGAAISLGSASWNGGRVFGPLLASLVAVVGPSWAFVRSPAVICSSSWSMRWACAKCTCYCALRNRGFNSTTSPSTARLIPINSTANVSTTACIKGRSRPTTAVMARLPIPG